LKKKIKGEIKMKATELIGKTVIRTVPTSSGDWSFTSSPIKILYATEDHVVVGKAKGDTFGILNRKAFVLDKRWVDGWKDYEEIQHIIDKHEEIPNKTK
jgi:hypothetical protein